MFSILIQLHNTSFLLFYTFDISSPLLFYVLFLMHYTSFYISELYLRLFSSVWKKYFSIFFSDGTLKIFLVFLCQKVSLFYSYSWRIFSKSCSFAIISFHHFDNTISFPSRLYYFCWKVGFHSNCCSLKIIYSYNLY